jgi:uncharacterized glyoxalase superfamily protein PhnB
MSLARNRSMPAHGVLPVLNYRDVRAAVAWLCRAFGARERLRIGEHRAQMLIGDGAFIVAAFHGTGIAHQDAPRHSMLVRIDDVDAHMKHAAEFGARVLARPTEFPYGERQYTAEDAGGHVWTFSQTMADVDPAAWGGTLLTKD